MASTKWVIDPSHSEIQFKARHLMISNVNGTFQKFDADVTTEGDDFTTAKVHFTADIDSLSTNNEQRDGHLKSADFFDAANHEQIIFDSTGIEKKDEDNFIMNGNLTIRGTTKPISLNVEHGGLIKDPWGNNRAGFEVTGKINRNDFGLSFSAITETGGLVVGEEIKLHANVEFVKQAAETPAA